MRSRVVRLYVVVCACVCVRSISAGKTGLISIHSPLQSRSRARYIFASGTAHSTHTHTHTAHQGQNSAAQRGEDRVPNIRAHARDYVHARLCEQLALCATAAAAAAQCLLYPVNQNRSHACMRIYVLFSTTATATATASPHTARPGHGAIHLGGDL